LIWQETQPEALLIEPRHICVRLLFTSLHLLLELELEQVELQPAVVLEPSFATTSTELAQRFNGQGATISGRSSLVISIVVCMSASSYGRSSWSLRIPLRPDRRTVLPTILL